MGRPKVYGMKTSYIPNAKADMRFKKKIYQRGKEYADSPEERKERRMVKQIKKSAPPCETCLRWPECNGVDAEACPLGKDVEHG